MLEITIMLILVLIVVVVLMLVLFPHVQKLFGEKMGVQFFQNRENDFGPLAQIFFRYRHRDTNHWIEWILAQDLKTQGFAINKLVEHIESTPSSWGVITGEAIKALAKFQSQEHIPILKEVIATAKKIWHKYKIAEACYEEACKGIIVINEESGIKLLTEELRNRMKTHNEDKVNCILRAMEQFKEDTDISELYKQIIIDNKESYQCRNLAIRSVEKKGEEASHKIFLYTLKYITEHSTGVYSGDDIKIFETLLNLVTQYINDECFEVIIAACNSDFLSKVTIKTMEFILKSHFSRFNSRQIYQLINLERDVSASLQETMSMVYNLNSAEMDLVEYKDLEKLYPFTKAPVAHEVLTRTIEIPKGLEEVFQKFKEELRVRAMMKQNGEHGGILLTGNSDLEKVLIARAAAAEKRWSFIYATYDDLIAMSSNIRTLLDIIHSNKPCLLYFNDINSLLSNPENSFTKNLKHLSIDPMVFLVGSIREESEINKDGSPAILANTTEAKIIFPVGMQLTNLTEAQKNKILQSKLSGLNSNREQDNVEQYNILEPTYDMTYMEFEKYLTKYFRASLLANGFLIPSNDFLKIDSVEFKGRGSL